MLLLLSMISILILPTGLRAQQAGYFQTNLVSNTAGVATTTDPQLLNPWGISILPGQDFWIANNNSGTSTLYDENGNKDALPEPLRQFEQLLASAGVGPNSQVE